MFVLSRLPSPHPASSRKKQKPSATQFLQDLFPRWPLECWWQAVAPWETDSEMIAALTPPCPPLSLPAPRQELGCQTLLYNSSLLMWKFCWRILLLGQEEGEKATAVFKVRFEERPKEWGPYSGKDAVVNYSRWQLFSGTAVPTGSSALPSRPTKHSSAIWAEF